MKSTGRRLRDRAQVFLEARLWLAVIFGMIAVGVLLNAIHADNPSVLGSGVGQIITFAVICAGLLAVVRAVRSSSLAIIEAIPALARERKTGP